MTIAAKRYGVSLQFQCSLVPAHQGQDEFHCEECDRYAFNDLEHILIIVQMIGCFNNINDKK